MIKVRFIAFFLILSVVFPLFSQAQKFNLLVGSSSNAETDGIYVYEFNSQTGEITNKTKATVNRPTYIITSPDLKYVYSITESANISSFEYNKVSGELIYINKQSSGGAGPIHISEDFSGRYLFAANYDGGSLTALPVRVGGGLGPVMQTIQHTGSSIDKVRQTKPYVHSVVPSPDNKYLITQDLGIDNISIYRFNSKKNATPVTLNPAIVNMAPGTGPRFFTFHPNKKYAYVIQELTGMITAFAYKSGRLNPLQTVTMPAESFSGRNGAADIHVSPDGKFLYGSNRGDANELAIYSIDQKTGKLTFAGRYPSAARSPRYFAIDPTGNFLFLTNQGSNDITVLKRDQTTGLLSATGQKISLRNPVCLQFVKID